MTCLQFVSTAPRWPKTSVIVRLQRGKWKSACCFKNILKLNLTIRFFCLPPQSVTRAAVAENAGIKYSEVILLGENELLNSNTDKDLTYQSVCNLQTYSSNRYSPLPVSGAQTPQDTRKSEMKCIKSSNTDLSSFPSIYSNILVSQTLKRLLTPVLYSSCPKSTISENGVKLQLGGDSEPGVSLEGGSATRSDSPLSQTDGLKTFPHFLRQHQSSVSFSDFSSISHSTTLPSHPTKVTSTQLPSSQSLYYSVPSLQPVTFTHRDALSDTFTTSLSPFPNSLVMDFSYCPP